MLRYRSGPGFGPTFTNAGPLWGLRIAAILVVVLVFDALAWIIFTLARQRNLAGNDRRLRHGTSGRMRGRSSTSASPKVRSPRTSIAVCVGSSRVRDKRPARLTGAESLPPAAICIS